MEETSRDRARSLLSMVIEIHMLHHGFDDTLEVIKCTGEAPPPQLPQVTERATQVLPTEGNEWSSLSLKTSNVRWADLDDSE